MLWQCNKSTLPPLFPSGGNVAILSKFPNEISVFIPADFGLSKIIDEQVTMKTVCGTPGYCGEFPTERFESETFVVEAVVASAAALHNSYLSLEREKSLTFCRLFELHVFQVALLLLHQACLYSVVCCVSQRSSVRVWELTACLLSVSLSPQLPRFSEATPTAPKWTCGPWESSSTYCECDQTLGNLCPRDLDVLSFLTTGRLGVGCAGNTLSFSSSHRKHYQT